MDDVITETHIFTIILPAVDAVIQGIVELVNPWPVPVSTIDPGWVYSGTPQALVQGAGTNVIPFRRRK